LTGNIDWFIGTGIDKPANMLYYSQIHFLKNHKNTIKTRENSKRFGKEFFSNLHHLVG
jgi:hypothetical protein